MTRIPIILDKSNSCPYDKPYGYIYLITNLVNGHRYVGKHRQSEPKLDTGYHGSGRRLWRAYRKYGKENFSMEILEWVSGSNKELNEHEIFWIDMLKTFVNHYDYNETPGGEGQSTETMTGDKNPMYGNHRWAGENNPMYNVHRPHTDEEKQRHSQDMIRAYQNNLQLRNAQSQFMKDYHKAHPEVGKRLSEQQRVKLKNPDYLKFLQRTSKITSNSFWSSDRGKLQREVNRTKFQRGGNPMAKPVVHINHELQVIKQYSCLEDTAEDGYVPGYIGCCCRNEYRFTSKKYLNSEWMFLEDYKQLVSKENGVIK